jgi:hypothetical protein
VATSGSRSRSSPHRGEAALRSFDDQFGAGGSIDLQPCVVTDGGVQCVVEFGCTGWGDRDHLPWTGSAVHERAGDGLLAAVRVYHDIDPAANDR